MSNLYEDHCEVCHSFNLALNTNKTSIKSLQKEVDKAYKTLHESGSYSPEDISKYKGVIEATNKVYQEALTTGIKDNAIPGAMLKALQNDTFLFAALKTHAQLTEASRLLLDKDKKLKSFQLFSNDIQKIKSNYNENYLEAEYNFAVAAAQMAGKWSEVESNDGRYNIQYRTAGDDKVRDSHRALDLITLPSDDAFWNQYYPPNGWRCRCTAVEVLKSKYTLSDSNDSIAIGNKATTLIGKNGKNKLEIFRFNPGKEKVIFPPKHPYGKVIGAKYVKEYYGKFKMTKNNIQSLKSRGFQIFDDTKQNLSFFNKNFAGFDFLELDAEFTAIAESFDLSLTSKKLVFHSDRIVFQYQAGNQLSMTRDLFLDGGSKYVYHNYLSISYKLQGNGISKQLFKALYKQYDAVKIDVIKVYANINVGGYAWAKYGFEPYDDRDIELIFKKADNLLSNGQISKVEHDVIQDFKKKYSDTNTISFHALANTTCGKVLLLDTGWSGKLHLNNKVQKSVFESYLGWK